MGIEIQTQGKWGICVELRKQFTHCVLQVAKLERRRWQCICRLSARWMYCHSQEIGHELIPIEGVFVCTLFPVSPKKMEE